MPRFACLTMGRGPRRLRRAQPGRLARAVQPGFGGAALSAWEVCAGFPAGPVLGRDQLVHAAASAGSCPGGMLWLAMRTWPEIGHGWPERLMVQRSWCPRSKASTLGVACIQAKGRVVCGDAGAADAEGGAVQVQHRVLAAGFCFGREFAPLGRLGQPWLPVWDSKAERGLGSGPWQRDPAAVAAADGVSRAFPDGVVDVAVGEVLDFPKPEFLALVEERQSGQCQQEQQHGAGTAGTQGPVAGRERIGRRDRDSGERPAVAGNVAGFVMAGEHPGGRRARLGRMRRWCCR